MPSERVQRRIDRLLDEAEQAMDAADWSRAQRLSREVLLLDTTNRDAQAFLASAEGMLAGEAVESQKSAGGPAGSVGASASGGPLPVPEQDAGAQAPDSTPDTRHPRPSSPAA